MQFDYGLRQGRSLALADRPESFVTAEGKVIKVEKKVAKANEKVQGRGTVSLSLSSTSVLSYMSAPSPFRFPRPFTRNWNVKYSPNKSRSLLTRKRSIGQHGAFSPLTTSPHDLLPSYSCLPILSRLVNMLSCLTSLVEIGVCVSEQQMGVLQTANLFAA